MVARSSATTFVPAATPRIAIASDGTLAAIHEPTRITIVDLPGCNAFAEVGIDPEAGSSEVSWVGAPPRLAVLSRYAAHSTVHLLDPYGPRTIAEIRLEAPMKLMSAVGAHALAVGALGAAVLTAGDSTLTPYQFPARTVPIAAGAAAQQFVVAIGGAIEEWDPQSRMPKRRLKLPRPAVITGLGGSDRVVWMTTQADPTRIDVFPLVNRGQPKLHELPEPISHVTSHPRSDLLVCVGADHGRLYVVDLDGRSGLRTIGPEKIDRVEAAGLVTGRMIGVLAAQAKHPLALVPLDGREPGEAVAMPQTLPLPREHEADPVAKPSSTLYEAEPPTAVTLQGSLSALAPDLETASPVVSQLAQTLAKAVAPKPKPAPAPPPPAQPKSSTMSGTALAERFSMWRDRMRSSQPRSDQSQPVRQVPAEVRLAWRDELALWTRGFLSNSIERGAIPSHESLEKIATRFELPEAVWPAIALLYGAHLAGEDGVAPVDVARVLGRNWDEALGNGTLASSLVCTFTQSRVRLHPMVERKLDNNPVATGTLVGSPGPVMLVNACIVVAPDDQPLGLVAEATLPAAGGAILAVHANADAHDAVVEARARGAVAMVRATPQAIERIPTNTTAIFVIPDESIADALDLPRL
ncbi:MAG: hypothetical protein QM831_41445 [Kofleriaceae bacterium]